MMPGDWLDRLARRAASRGAPQGAAAAPERAAGDGMTRGTAIGLAVTAGATAWLQLGRPLTAAAAPSGPLKTCLGTCTKQEAACRAQPPCAPVSQESYERYLDRNCKGCDECLERCRAASAAYANDRLIECVVVHGTNCLNDHADCDRQCNKKCATKRKCVAPPPPPRVQPPIQPPPPSAYVDYCAPCTQVGGVCCPPRQPDGNICACASPGLDCLRYGCT